MITVVTEFLVGTIRRLGVDTGYAVQDGDGHTNEGKGSQRNKEPRAATAFALSIHISNIGHKFQSMTA
jgi:hypothetical protein